MNSGIIKSIFLIFLISANAYSMEEDSNKRKHAEEEKSEIAGLSKKLKLEHSTLGKNETEDNLDITEQILTDINQVLQAIQYLDSETAQDIIETLKKKLDITKAFWIMFKLPVEIADRILLFNFMLLIDTTADLYLSHNTEMNKKEILKCLYKTQKKIEEYITKFLTSLSKLNSKNINLFDNFIHLMKSDFFRTRLSNYFKKTILDRLKDIPLKANTQLCSHLIKKMRTKIVHSAEFTFDWSLLRNIDNLEMYDNPWKFIINPLIDKLEATNCKDYFIVCWAVQNDNLEFIKDNKYINKLIVRKRDSDRFFSLDERNQTLLMHAITSHAFTTAQWMIEKKIQLNKIDRTQATALIHAINLLCLPGKREDHNFRKECHKLIKALLEQGAKLLPHNGQYENERAKYHRASAWDETTENKNLISIISELLQKAEVKRTRN